MSTIGGSTVLKKFTVSTNTNSLIVTSASNTSTHVYTCSKILFKHQNMISLHTHTHPHTHTPTQSVRSSGGTLRQRTSSQHRQTSHDRVAMEMEEATLVAADDDDPPTPDEDSTWEAI